MQQACFALRVPTEVHLGCDGFETAQGDIAAAEVSRLWLESMARLFAGLDGRLADEALVRLTPCFHRP